MLELMPGYSRRKSTDLLILHHSAALSDLTTAEINAMHKGQGWKGIGYNLYIRQAGDLHIGRGEDAVGAHAGAMSGKNSVSVGVCLSGNFEVQHPTEAQLRTLIPLLARLCRKYGLTAKAIVGHRDVNPTACPGKNMPMAIIRAEVSALLSGGAPLTQPTLAPEQVENLMESVRGLYAYWEQVPESWRQLVRKLRAHPILPPQ